MNDSVRDILRKLGEDGAQDRERDRWRKRA